MKPRHCHLAVADGCSPASRAAGDLDAAQRQHAQVVVGKDPFGIVAAEEAACLFKGMPLARGTLSPHR